MKMNQDIWLALGIAINALLATVSQAQTTSWIAPSGGKWERTNDWSDGMPSIAQSAVIISNAHNKVVRIDAHTVRKFPDSLTISNLTINPPSGTTDTLYLDNTGTIALHVLNGLTIGISPDYALGGGSVLISTNSTLIVDGLLDGELLDNGTMVFTGGSLITTNCSLHVTASFSPPYSPLGLLVLSNANVQARDVAIGTTSLNSGTIEMFGGTMHLSSFLAVGYSDGIKYGYGTLLVADGALLVVTNGVTTMGSLSGSYGTITVTNATMLAKDMWVGTGYECSGYLFVEAGTVTLQGSLTIGDHSDAGVSLNGGILVATNTPTILGGEDGYATTTIEDGLLLAQDLLIGSEYHSEGILTVNGGSVTVSEGITLGDCNNDSAFGYVAVDGGQLIVTNAAGTGFVNIQDGQLTLSNGLLQVDKLVMTADCGSFVHTGGTLIIGGILFDSHTFQITSVAREGSNLRVTWLMGPGQTSALQVSCGGAHGSYSTNGFSDIFIVTNNTVAVSLTNYLDIGAATNFPAHYYRARLAL
jgi:hypothetical protein